MVPFRHLLLYQTTDILLLQVILTGSGLDESPRNISTSLIVIHLIKNDEKGPPCLHLMLIYLYLNETTPLVCQCTREQHHKVKVVMTNAWVRHGLLST